MPQEQGGGERSAGESGAAVGLVGEGESLFGGIEEQRVFAHDLAGPDRLDGGGFPPRTRSLDLLGDRESRAAGGVSFFRMVGFDQFDLRWGGEVAGGVSREFFQNGHPDAEISAVKYRDDSGAFFDQLAIGFR